MKAKYTFNENLSVPKHVAVIMDGNGRWAQERGKKRTEGHYEGLMALRRVAIAAHKMGVKVVTAYAFSTENWKRPLSEVNYLMTLPKSLNDDVLPDLMKNNVQVRLTGSLDGVPKVTQKYIKNAIEKTHDNTGLIVNVAFNYGSRHDIVEATKAIVDDVQSGKLTTEQIDEALFAKHLATGHLGELSDPDFLIRSSGEVRLSNYLLWELAYSEMLFVDTKWPDFDEEVFKACIGEYQHRQRRYGKTGEQIETDE
ncbi:isoprenyl transferase [Aerococcus suis]|uniref:Isoprenyl transferase n=1 Tax=Aerococcus suis TaxID=371602 RepID=A0A1W1Y8L7_9LACT|nr:isoprenyl transferase [Aerococcus suis]MCI7240577.1 isoprenyl transferase [Aerococcus suis]MDY4647007.1 isoprenyl transferase [Aerococcus suis]SMC32171.1 Undecaprenyl pyrophosphate synthetase [Aerococcus suis]